MNKLELVIMKQMEEIEQLRNKYIDETKKVDKYKKVLDKIKEEVEYWGYEEEYNDDRIFCKCMKKIHELLEEIE